MLHAETVGNVRRFIVEAGLLALFALLAVTPAVAQEAVAPPVSTPSPTPQPSPIPASDIPSRAADAADAAREAVANSSPDARIQQIQQDLPDERARIEELRLTSEEKLAKPGPASLIKEDEKSWVRAQARLERWLVDLSSRSGALDGTLDDLNKSISLWQLTRDHESGA